MTEDLKKTMHVRLPYNAYKHGYFVKSDTSEPLLFSMPLCRKNGRMKLLAFRDFEMYDYGESLYVSCRAGSELYVVANADDVEGISDERREFVRVQRQQGNIVVMIDGQIFAVKPRTILDACI